MQRLQQNIVHEDMEREYKHLPSIFERGLNTEHHIGQGETWDQQLAQVSEKMLEAGTSSPNYDKISRDIARTQGPHVSDLPARMNFVKKLGGGSRTECT